MRRSRHTQATKAPTGRREYAMYNENEVRIIGNLGRDPRVHDGGEGRKVAQLSVEVLPLPDPAVVAEPGLLGVSAKLGI